MPWKEIAMMDWGHGGMMDGSGFGILGMIFGFMFMLLFTVGSVLLIVWIVKQFAPAGTAASPPISNSLEILKERFARGEISKEDFTEMKKELMK